MRKWIISGTVAVVLAMAVIAAILNVNFLIERNKGYLVAQAEQALGRKISVSQVEATLFTGVGLRLVNFSISDDPAYSSDDFLRAKDVQVNLKFWPLLKKQIEVKRVILREPVIHIIRDSRGKFNFSTLAPGHKEKEKEERARKDKPKPARREDGGSGFPLALANISDGDIRYFDRKEGSDLRLSQVDLRLEDIDHNGPFSVRLAAALFAEKQNFVLTGTIGPFSDDSAISQVPVDGEADIDPLDFTRLNAAMPALKSALPKDLGLSGLFRAKDLRFKGSLGDFSASGQIEAGTGALRYGDVFQKAAGTPLTLTADARYNGETITINKSRLKLHTIELTGAGDIQLADATAVNLSLSSEPVSLRSLGEFFPALSKYEMNGTIDLRATVRGQIGKGAMPRIQGSLGLQNASAKPPDFPQPIRNLDTKINFTGERADISDMSLSLGKSRIRLTAAIDKFAPLTITYTMSTPEIWPADYKSSLPAERGADILRDLRSEGRFTLAGAKMLYDGKLSSAQGTLYNIPYKGLDAKLAVADQVATIDSLRVNILQGSVEMAGEYSFKDPAPSFAAASKIQGIDIKEVYGFLDPEAEHDIRGRVNGEMKLAGRGKNWEAIKSTLHGQGATEILQGALLNFNIAEGTLGGITGMPGLAQMINPALRKKYPETFTAKDTEFDELKANFEVGDGRVNVKNLRITAAEFTVQGNGWVDFTRRIDLPATLMFSQRLSSDLSQSAREVKYFFNDRGQLEVPVTVTGRLPNVKPRPDLKHLGQLAQRGFVREGADELQNRFLGRDRSRRRDESAPAENKSKKRDSTEELIRKGLENLFKR